MSKIKICFRCKGKRTDGEKKSGRFLKPRSNSKTNPNSPSKTWVECDLCEGTGILVYPFIGEI